MEIEVEENTANELPENHPFYKDSGLWQMRSDDMKTVLVQQKHNESLSSFIASCIEYEAKGK